MTAVAKKATIRRLDLAPANHRPTRRVVETAVPRDPVKNPPRYNPPTVANKAKRFHRWSYSSKREKHTLSPPKIRGASQFRFSKKPPSIWTLLPEVTENDPAT